jgi:hypothetical protein
MTIVAAQDNDGGTLCRQLDELQDQAERLRSEVDEAIAEDERQSSLYRQALARELLPFSLKETSRSQVKQDFARSRRHSARLRREWLVLSERSELLRAHARWLLQQAQVIRDQRHERRQGRVDLTEYSQALREWGNAAADHRRRVMDWSSRIASERARRAP